MRIIMLGVNHQTAPVELRERVAMVEDRLDRALDRLHALYPSAELVIVSTCNRTELYIARPAHDAPGADDLRRFLAEFGQCDLSAVTAATIQREQEQAVAHLFEVAAGLESMVLGEAEILGQVRRAYGHAHARGFVGPVLHRVFQQALAAAKQARSVTGIDRGRVSVGSAAVDFARRIFDRFDDKTVVGIGAGELARSVLRHLMALEPNRLWVTNRTLDKARQLAATLDQAEARSFDDLDELLVEADIVLTGTASNEPIIRADRFKSLRRRRRSRPLFLIDVAIPRDVEPAVGTFANVYLYNLDDLQRVVAATFDQRSGQVAQCRTMLHEAVQQCMAQLHHRLVGQLVRELRTRLHELGRIEHRRTVRKLIAADPDELDAILDEHTQRLINKILHVPLSQLHRPNHDVPLGFYAAALRNLFDLTGRVEDDEQQVKTSIVRFEPVKRRA